MRSFLHPSLDTLNDFLAASPSERARTARHLEHCTRCRESLQFLRTLDARVGALDDIEPPSDLLARVVTTREGGGRVVLPVSDVGRARPARRLIAAAAVLLLAAMGLVMSTHESDVEAGTTSGVLRLTPSMPKIGEALRVRYQPMAMLANRKQLSLRARVRSRNGTSYNTGIPIATIATLTRERDGSFSGRVVLPDSVVYAALSIEDSSGATIDANGGRWEILVAANDGRPKFEALDQRAHDMMGRNWEAGFETARRMVALYPDDVRGWSWLQAHQAWLGRGKDDSVLAQHRARFEAFDARFARDSHLDPAMIGHMYWYSRLIDSVANQRWHARLLRDAPNDGFAIEDRVLAVLDTLFRRKDTTLALAKLDTLWQQAPDDDRRSQVGSYAASLATARHDSALARRWTTRLFLTEANRPALERGVAMQFARDTLLREEGMQRLRAALATVDVLDPAERALTETVEKQRARHAGIKRTLLAALGRALVATGRNAAGLDTLARASATGWSLDIFRSVRVASLAAGDTTSALRMAARIAADPRTDSLVGDSLRRVSGGADVGAWRAQLATARNDFVDRMLDDATVRSLRGSVTLRDAENRAFDLGTLANGHVTIVAFWSRFCGPAIEAMPEFDAIAHRLMPAGVRVVTIAEEPGPSAELSAFLKDKKITLPMYFDPLHVASKAFNEWGTPTFYVVDADGRIRYDATSSVKEVLARVEALRWAGDRRTAAR